MHDIKESTVSATRKFAFTVPSYKKTMTYLLVVSFTTGVILHLLFGNTITYSLLFGGTDGIVLFALPAVIASIIAASFNSKKEFKQTFKYFTFLSLLAVSAISLLYCIGTLFKAKISIEIMVVLANAMVYLIWLISTYVPLNYGKKAIILSFIHPMLNLSFLQIYKGYVIFLQPIEMNSPLLIIKLLIACFVFLLALWSVFIIINAPAKKNFGISAIEAAAMFFAQYLKGTKELEEVLGEMKEKAITYLGLVAFKARKKTKALFLIPFVHYGPFGNLGGSEFPAILSKKIGEFHKTEAFVFHSTTNHDYNPIYSKSVELIEKEYNKMIESIKESQEKARFIIGSKENAHVFGIALGKSAFLTLSRAPKGSEDFEPAIGIALRNKVLSKGFKEAILVDRHNCKTTGKEIRVSGKEFFDYEKAIEEMQEEKEGILKLGVASDSLSEFKTSEGIGKMGLKVAVLEIEEKKACIILIDANNVIPQFRKEILESLKEKKFFFIDIFTTDTHAVNTFNMIHNPLGEKCDKKRLLQKIIKTVEEAEKNIEPCKATIKMTRIEIDVLGTGRASELLSTISSIVSILKILAPVILLTSVLAAAILLIIIK